MNGSRQAQGRRSQASTQRKDSSNMLIPNTANRICRDESEITSVEAASVEDVDKAVAAARKAFKDPTWRDMASTERGDLLYKLSQLVEEHKETLATIETWDNGMTICRRPENWLIF
jgi:acyl-CoA reductase-like NAD-dependent aldehyde dehydrogenase